MYYVLLCMYYMHNLSSYAYKLNAPRANLLERCEADLVRGMPHSYYKIIRDEMFIVLTSQRWNVFMSLITKQFCSLSLKAQTVLSYKLKLQLIYCSTVQVSTV
jgi:hypothetical protein